jgi:hypothetical protein
MPTHLKNLVRSRMAKTGESYATALRYVRRRGEKLRAVRAGAEPGGPPFASRDAQPSVASPDAPRIRYAGAVRRDSSIDAYVRSKPAPVGETLARLVAIARAAAPAHDELVHRGAPSFCIDGEPYCYLVDFSRHVTLGFCHGFALPDPEGLLEGRGKYQRHVKVKPGGSMPTGAISKLVAASARRVRALRSADPKGAKEVRRG